MQDAQLISQAGLVESLASDGLVSVSTGAGQPQKNMELAKFADSLGSSVPLQQNAEQVGITGLYARTSDGKMVELTKESVAQVMAGLMGNPLRRESVVTEDSVDGALKPGFYTMVFEPISIGGGTSNFYGVMNVYESDTYIVQVGYATSGVILRNYRKSSKVWSEWQRIDNFGYNSIEALSSGVAQQMGNPLAMKNWGKADADTILESGFYLNSNKMTNVPEPYGTLLSLAYEPTHCVQLYFFATSSNVIYYRNRTAQVWSSWQKLQFDVIS